MTLKQARKLRDDIRKNGVHCVVPLGHGPRGYFAVIQTTSGPLHFTDPAQWKTYKVERDKREFKRRMAETRKSPLDFMIDQACGLLE